MTDKTQKFLAVFAEECREALDTMEQGLMRLDSAEADAETIHEVFRAAHSIKGGAATLGMKALATFTHDAETLLDLLREGQRPIVKSDIDLLLAAVDCMRELTAGGAEPNERSEDVTRRLLEALDASPAAPSSEPGDTSAPASAPAERVWQIQVSPLPHMLHTGNEPVMLFAEVQALGELSVRCDSSALPALDALDATTAYLKWELELRGDAQLQELEEIFDWLSGEADVEIHEATDTDTAAPEVDEAEPEAAAATPTAAAGPPRRAGSERESTIRVSIDKIDEIVNLVGELVITQSMLGQLGRDGAQTGSAQLRDGLANLERNTRELQESVMRIRMLPIGHAFQRLPRLVRDLADQLGKEVDLVLEGEGTELDKTVLEKISDPLVHLVRNGLDHGIESPEVRAAAGKPRRGRLSLDARHQGGNIVIEICDDGAGLNRERLLDKARRQGLIAEGQTLSDAEVDELIFHPGLSTAQTISDISGRGVGMDVVQRNIKALGGHISVESRPEAGTRFQIRLPLTMAILDGQLVRVGEQTYIVPLISISESLQIDGCYVRRLAGRATAYNLREEAIPVVSLSHAFKALNLDTSSVAQLDAGNLLVVVEANERRLGLVVDELLGQQQVVIKSLEQNFRRVPGIAGATILGDGRVALILDVAGLVDDAPATTPSLPSLQKAS